MEKPLDGVAVLSCEVQIAGPYCTMMLADQGADVVKVEQPGTGDVARNVAPILTGEQGEQQSGYFLRFNRNKRSLTLEPEERRGPRDLPGAGAGRRRAWSRTSDPASSTSSGSATTSCRGETLASCTRASPASAAWRASTAPTAGGPAYDIVAQAMGGVMNTCGQAGGPPTWAGTRARRRRHRDERRPRDRARARSSGSARSGPVRSTSPMYDTIVALAERAVTAYSLTGRVLERGREPFMAPWGPFECSDGWVALIVATERDWERFCEAIERPDLVGREGTSVGAGAGGAACGLAGRDRRRLVPRPDEGRGGGEAAGGRRSRSGRCRTRQEIFECPQVAARRAAGRRSRPGARHGQARRRARSSCRAVPEPVARPGAAARRAHGRDPAGGAGLLRGARSAGCDEEASVALDGPETDEVAIVSAVRSPFGKFGGTLRDFTLPELGGIVVRRGDQARRDRPGRRRGGRHRRQPAGRRPLDRPPGPDRRGDPARAASPTRSTGPAARRWRRSRWRPARSGSATRAIAVAGGTENMSKVPYFLTETALGPLARRHHARGPARDRLPDDRQAARGPGRRGGGRVRHHPRGAGRVGASQPPALRGRPRGTGKLEDELMPVEVPGAGGSRSSSPRTSRCARTRRSRSSPG